MTTLLVATSAPAMAQRAPIIDMHFHAMTADAMGPRAAICSPYEGWPIREAGRPIEAYLQDFTVAPECKVKFVAPETTEELVAANARVLEKYNITALADGRDTTVAALSALVPGRIMQASAFGSGEKWPTPDELRAQHRAGKLKSLSEITIQYAGIAPTDPRFAPYWALAEELDIPVGIHMGPGPPGTSYFATPKYRMALTDPLQLEEVLMKHPKLRVFVMHAGWPMADRMMALMYAHPQVYVETGVIDHAFPRAEFHRYLKQLVDAGFGKRVMFGSDQMVWPGAIEVAIANVESANFLTAEQKRDIFYNNAARFLRLKP
ncbi:MAG TPA: amidohydrolase family protein [Sphingomicrobium sp.]|nr:amidohydrolase family protein [Sphingomicrobium sp.]